jgi:ribosome-associated toxin RatA of RatAB toxin-antitoxin module
MPPIRLRILLALAALPCSPGAADPEWRLVREEQGVRIFTRAIAGVEIHQLRAETRIRATLVRLMEVYLDVERHMRWYPGCIAARVVRRDAAGGLLLYHRIDNPWPVKDRDYALAIDTGAAEEPGGKVARYRDVPGAVPETRDCVRMRKLRGSWKFVPEPDGFTAVTYVFDFDPGPGAPATFINMSLPKIGESMLAGLARGAEPATAGRSDGKGSGAP